MPALGGGSSRRYVAMMFGKEKLECYGYPMVKKFLKMFIRFDRMYEHDRQTTQTPHDGIGRACIASRGKNGENWNVFSHSPH